VAEDIRALSAVLASDPSSLRYVELAEALRRRGKLEEAIQVALHGLGRHPDHAEGYDCLARAHADRGELTEARAAWERALAIVPEHPGALRGIGFVFFRQGDSRRAAEALEHALAANPADEAARWALETVRGTSGQRRPPPESVPEAEPLPLGKTDRPNAFLGLEGATADMLLLDERGLVLAGGLRAADGSDATELAAAALAGGAGEGSRTAAYLGLGAWSSIVAEAETANLVLAPVERDALLMVRRDKSTPAALALRIAERARAAAQRWLEEQGA
jgi:tetratricopeptide (TPR) repeat protein